MTQPSSPEERAHALYRLELERYDLAKKVAGMELVAEAARYGYIAEANAPNAQAREAQVREALSRDTEYLALLEAIEEARDAHAVKDAECRLQERLLQLDMLRLQRAHARPVEGVHFNQ